MRSSSVSSQWSEMGLRSVQYTFRFAYYGHANLTLCLHALFLHGPVAASRFLTAVLFCALTGRCVPVNSFVKTRKPFSDHSDFLSMRSHLKPGCRLPERRGDSMRGPAMQKFPNYSWVLWKLAIGNPNCPDPVRLSQFSMTVRLWASFGCVILQMVLFETSPKSPTTLPVSKDRRR